MRAGASTILDLRPAQVIPACGIQTRQGQFAVPDGPGWYKRRASVSHRMRFAMLDAETTRLTVMVDDPVTAATTLEFVVPRPADHALPESVILAGSGIELSERYFDTYCAESGRTVRRSRRSAFVTSDIRHGPKCFADSVSHRHAERYGGPTVAAGITGEHSNSSLSGLAANVVHHIRPRQENAACEVVAERSNLSSQNRIFFPDLFYAHNPERYSRYKDDCTAGYADFPSFIRHSLSKHERHLEQEGIMRQIFEEAKRVTPGPCKGENKKERRYLLVREKLFGTPQHVPIPLCEHGDSHPVIKVRAGRGKRKRSPEDGVFPSQIPPSVPLDLHTGFREPTNTLSASPTPAVANQTQSGAVVVQHTVISSMTTSATTDAGSRLLTLETEFQKLHQWLQQAVFEASNHCNMLERYLPGTPYTQEDVMRRTRLHEALVMHKSLTNELWSKLDDFGESDKFPCSRQQQYSDSDRKQNDIMSASGISLSNHSTSSGPWVATDASASSLDGTSL